MISYRCRSRIAWACRSFSACAGSFPALTICSSWVSAAALTWVQVGTDGGELVSFSCSPKTDEFLVVGQDRVLPGALDGRQVTGGLVPLHLDVGLGQPLHELPGSIPVRAVLEDGQVGSADERRGGLVLGQGRDRVLVGKLRATGLFEIPDLVGAGDHHRAGTVDERRLRSARLRWSAPDWRSRR